jgi:UDP-N-acetylglucosamine--N-acetylmuramyl-(pentapeptide) pyrophosphoryl-undecaprenol N-acetylglucosamine transferase
MGGSQGATGINQLLLGSIPILAAQAPDLQFLHLTGPDDCEKLQAGYAAHGRRAVVRPFLTEMELALGAATIAVNRAGASSLAELAAVRVPAILIPYPHATDDHQLYNARALVQSGAARLLVQSSTTAAALAAEILGLLNHPETQTAIRAGLQAWHFPNAAQEIAGHIFSHLGLPIPAPIPDEDEASLPPRGLGGLRPWQGANQKFTASRAPAK